MKRNENSPNAAGTLSEGMCKRDLKKGKERVRAGEMHKGREKGKGNDDTRN